MVVAELDRDRIASVRSQLPALINRFRLAFHAADARGRAPAAAGAVAQLLSVESGKNP